MKKRWIGAVLCLGLLVLVLISPLIRKSEIREPEVKESEIKEPETKETTQQNKGGIVSQDMGLPKARYKDIVKKITEDIDPSGTRYFRNLLTRMQEDAEILSCQRDVRGFTFRFFREYTDSSGKEHSYEETVSFHIAEELPEAETNEEMRDFFLERHPEATMYYVVPMEGSNAGKDFFYGIEENGITYGYFTRMGKTYEIAAEGCDSYYNCVYKMRNELGFDYIEVCSWEKNEKGIAWSDFMERIFYREQDIGTGEKFCFQIAPPESGKSVGTKNPGIAEFDEDLEVSVYREGSDKPFQVFGTRGIDYSSQPVTFEDFNADGYLDLRILYYYGANGGTAFHYLWSPSKGQFVECSDELSYFGSYFVDMENRRLYMHHHASAICGTEFIYQWENEVDCRLIRKFIRDWAGDLIQFQVISYKGKKEQILLDYKDDVDGEASAFAWNFYYDDFIWKKEISDPASGETYHLYYAESPDYGDMEDGDGERNLEGYTECLYIVDRELHPVNYLEWKSEAAYVEAAYTGPGAEGEGVFEVRYADGQKKQYTFSEMTTDTFPEVTK